MNIPKHNIHTVQRSSDSHVIWIFCDSKTETNKKYDYCNRVNAVPKLSSPHFHFMKSATWLGHNYFSDLNKVEKNYHSFNNSYRSIYLTSRHEQTQNGRQRKDLIVFRVMPSVCPSKEKLSYTPFRRWFIAECQGRGTGQTIVFRLTQGRN